MIKRNSDNRPKILLVFPPCSGGRPGIKGIYYPLGIGYIAAVLRNEYNIMVHDFNYDFCLGHSLDSHHIENVLRDYNYDYLLIGGVFPKYRYLKKIIEISRGISKSIIILGGSYVKPCINIFASYLYADYYIMGEGEEVVLKLLGCISNGRPINEVDGIAYHNGTKLHLNRPAIPLSNLDEIPFPARDLSNFHIYKRRFSLGNPLLYAAYVITSRGCPLNCVFCNPAFGRKVKVRSPENIMEEVLLLQKDYNCNFIYFHDEVLLGGTKRNIIAFCEYVLSKRKSRFFWAGTTNPRFLDNKTLQLMKNAGCIQLSLGVESGSKTILKEMRKDNNLEQVKEVAASCDKLGIEYKFSLLTNTFSETEETLNETKNYLECFSKSYFRQPPEINFITPIPGTDLYSMAKEMGRIHGDDLQNLLYLNNVTQFGISWNLTNIETQKFVSLVNGINRNLTKHYFIKHPLQYLIYKCSNLTHFKLRESVVPLSINNSRPFVEGLLWALCRGNDDTLIGKLYKRIVYHN